MPRINEMQLLLVEDNEGHARLIEKNMRRALISNQIVKLTDGQQALDYLFGETGYVYLAAPPPLLILLDLNLPVVNGYQVLEAIKGDTRTKSIPVIILTTTDDAFEINRCYELGCNAYITKPVEYTDFAEAVSRLGLFLSIAMLPDGA